MAVVVHRPIRAGLSHGRIEHEVMIGVFIEQQVLSRRPWPLLGVRDNSGVGQSLLRIWESPD